MRMSSEVTPRRQGAIASASLRELTVAVLGSEMSMSEAWAHVLSRDPVPPSTENERIWVGSIGYERYGDVRDFVRTLVSHGVERLIDVRELPISRRRGYAKTALAEAVGAAGIEYIHFKALGNPKAYRDLYKSGDVVQGRDLYRAYLIDAQRDALSALPGMISEKRSALMCLEHDRGICHRDIIFDSLQRQLGLEIHAEELSQD